LFASITAGVIERTSVPKTPNRGLTIGIFGSNNF